MRAKRVEPEQGGCSHSRVDGVGAGWAKSEQREWSQSIVGKEMAFSISLMK